MKPLRIATRQSQLALWQANTTKFLLEKIGVPSTLNLVLTSGDKLQKSPLANISLTNKALPHHLLTGKGLFIKEIQEEILAGNAEIAVHSMKDLPVEQTKELQIISLLPRAAARDLLILSPKLLYETGLHQLSSTEKNKLSFEELKANLLKSPSLFFKGIGTTSHRRQLLLKKHLTPKLHLEALRGNIDTRLQRVRNNDFAAILLAEAGLERLQLLNAPDIFPLPVHLFIPAAAQGVIALEALETDVFTIKTLQSLNDIPTFYVAALERCVLKILGGDCHSAIAIHLIHNNIHIFCEQDGYINEAIISLIQKDWDLCSNLYIESNGIYSLFFEKLFQSQLTKKIKIQLLSSGFSYMVEN